MPLLCLTAHSHNIAAALRALIAILDRGIQYLCSNQSDLCIDEPISHAMAVVRSPKLVLQCVAIDPTEECIAAGDVSGRILIWNAFTHKVPKLHKAPQQQPSSAAAATNPSAAAAAPAAGHSTADQTAPQAAASRPAQNTADGSETDDDEDMDNTQQPAGAAAAAADAQEAPAAGNIPARSSAPDRAGQAEGQPQQNVVQSKETSGARFSRLRQSVESVPLTTVHWHAHPVGALCFSADGTLLLSGGQEGVLVRTSHAASW